MTRPILCGPRTPSGQPINRPGETVRIEFTGKYLTGLRSVHFKYFSSDDTLCYEAGGAIDNSHGRSVTVSYTVPEESEWTCRDKKENLTGGEVEVTVTNEENETDGSVYP